MNPTAPDNADLVAEALLRYSCDPSNYPVELLDACGTLAGLEVVVRLALGRRVEFADPALRIPRINAEAKRAALFFIEQRLFCDGASHYEVLGLAPDASLASIREHHRLLIQLVHPDRHKNNESVWSESVAVRVNRAYSVLKNADARAAYDQRSADARGKTGAAARTVAPVATPPATVVRRWRPVPPQMLPEWLTYKVGGFIWQHPAVVIFAGVIVVCALTIGAIAWSELEGTLTRDIASPVSASAASATSQTPAPAATAQSLVQAEMSQTAEQTLAQAPNSAAVSALIAAFIASYESGQLEALASLFDADAQTNASRGRAAIRHDYDELFRRSRWRRMDLKLLQWRTAGAHAEANGEILMKIGWHDGQEIEQRVAVEMELVRVDGRTLIARLSERVRN